MRVQVLHLLALLVAAAAVVAVASGCGNSNASSTESSSSEAAPTGISPQRFADAVHAVMMADRTVYAKHIVTRLKEEGSTVSASEYWADEENAIPLPAQMFRMGAELVDENPEAGFTYALKSQWPLNEQNKAKTPVEIEGLKYVADHPGENFYGEEELGEKTYYTAVYADKAVALACWDCHNNHPNRGDDFPEFAEGDVMGGVIVRIPLD